MTPSTDSLHSTFKSVGFVPVVDTLARRAAAVQFAVAIIWRDR
jgi:hypothetical protein